MLRLRSLEDVEAARLPDPLKRLVREHFAEMLKAFNEVGGYDPDDDGETVVLDPGDEVRRLHPFHVDPIKDLLFEYVEYDREAKCFVAIYIPSNSWGLTIYIPDQPRLDPATRDFLRKEVELSDVGAEG